MPATSNRQDVKSLVVFEEERSRRRIRKRLQRDVGRGRGKESDSRATSRRFGLVLGEEGVERVGEGQSKWGGVPAQDDGSIRFVSKCKC